MRTPLLNVDEAKARILEQIQTLPAEALPLPQALDRVLAEDIHSPIDLPPFDNSAMDGYAIRHADSASASPASPISLRVSMDIMAGDAPGGELMPKEAARIMTGAPIPAGCTAVIPVEDTDDSWQKGEHVPAPQRVALRRSLMAGENVRRAGENIAAGERVAGAGSLLRPAHIGMLAGIGCAKVSVIRKPKVVILSSGDELVDVHSELGPGQIRDSNSYTLAALIRQAGGIPIRLPIARDSLPEIRALYRHALSIDPDMIISTAGVSVGAADLVKVVMDELGDIDFWRINMRPGKPLAFGALRGLPFFGLPGNPVSTMVTYEVLVKPALAKLGGRDHNPRLIQAALSHSMRSDGRRSYIRVTLERGPAGFNARSTGIQSSGALMSMVLADGLAIIPEGQRQVAAGEMLSVLPLRELD